MSPIYATATCVHQSPGNHLGYEYSRSQSPSRAAWEACIADLEGGSHGFAYASGTAASDALMHLLAPGDHVLAMDDLYGGSWRLFERVRRRSSGLDFSFVDFGVLVAASEAFTIKKKMF